MIDDFYAWKQHVITQVIFEEFRRRVVNFTESLIENAGEDPVKDARKAGYIKACRDLLELKLDDLEESHGN